MATRPTLKYVWITALLQLKKKKKNTKEELFFFFCLSFSKGGPWLTFHSVPPLHQAVSVLWSRGSEIVSDAAAALDTCYMSVESLWSYFGSLKLTPYSSSSSRSAMPCSSLWAANHSAWTKRDQKQINTEKNRFVKTTNRPFASFTSSPDYSSKPGPCLHPSRFHHNSRVWKVCAKCRHAGSVALCSHRDREVRRR